MLYRNRYLWNMLLKELDTREALVITGARQSGKTTTLNWLMEQIESKNKLFLDLTLESTLALFEEYDAEGIAHVLKARGLDLLDRAYVAIDEIQSSEKIPVIVKYLIDHYNIKFFLTGSSAFYLKNQFSESLAGRKLIFEIFPLSFQEFLDFKQVNFTLPSMFDENTNLKEQTFDTYTYNLLQLQYEEYIQYGGFPAVVEEPNPQRKRDQVDLRA